VTRPTFQELIGAAGDRPARGARLPAFLGLQRDPGQVLDGLKAVVVGCGSVGRPIAVHLARQQIDTVWIIDRGHYKAESLLTQPITPDDVGRPKASSTGRYCKQVSPRTRVFALDGPVQALDEAALAGADVWLLATDNLSAEVEVGQRCLRLGKPLIHAAVHGDTLTAQVRCFANADGPCPACTFGHGEWAFLNKETVFSCEGFFSGERKSTTATMPTMSVSFLCSLAADLALTQLFRLVLGLGQPVRDTMIEHCGYTHRTAVAPLKRNPDCPCDHTRWHLAAGPRPLARCSLGELAAAAGLSDGVSFTVGELSFAELGICEACGDHRPAQRFIPATREAGVCPVCGGRVVGHPFYCHRPVPAARAVLDRPLGELHAADVPWVLVRSNGRAVLFRECEGAGS
jgi:molybdopterin/thiamine biosynthesis adenylyltransferase